MGEKNQQKKGTRLFKSNFLEAFTRVHPRFAISYNLFCSGCLLAINFYYGFVTPVTKVLLFWGLGFVSWTFAEYMLHRFFFHMKGDNKLVQRIAHTMHGIHHDHPNDYTRLFMPPLPATLFMVFFFVVFFAIMNVRVFAFLPGFLTGYLAYAYTHFKTHQIRAPKLLKFLWTHHLKHHYQDEDRAYGVSSPFWDIVFGTLPRKAIVKSEEKKEDAEPQAESSTQENS